MSGKYDVQSWSWFMIWLIDSSQLVNRFYKLIHSSSFHSTSHIFRMVRVRIKKYHFFISTLDILMATIFNPLLLLIAPITIRILIICIHLTIQKLHIHTTNLIPRAWILVHLLRSVQPVRSKPVQGRMDRNNLYRISGCQWTEVGMFLAHIKIGCIEEGHPFVEKGAVVILSEVSPDID